MCGICTAEKNKAVSLQYLDLLSIGTLTAAVLFFNLREGEKYCLINFELCN